MTVPSDTRAWRWRVFAATWASYAGFYMCRKPFYITKGALTSELGWDASVLANIGAAYLIAYMLGQFIAGWAGTRWGPRVALITGMALSAGCSLAFGLTNNPWTFAALMALNGLAQATGWSNNVGTLANWYSRAERGTMMGLWSTNLQFGAIASNALAAWSMGALGFRWAYVTGSAVLLLAWGLVLLWQRDTPEDEGLTPVPVDPGEAPPADDGSDWTANVILNTALIGVFYFFVKFVRYALWSWAPYVLEQRYAMAGDMAGLLSTSFDVAGIAGVIVAGWASDRWFGGRRAGVSLVSCLAMALCAAGLWAVADLGFWAFAASLSLIGFFLFGPDSLMSGAGAMDVGSRRTAVAATGIINGMGSAGSVVQEFVFGALLAAGGTQAALGTLVASSACASACLVVLVVRGRMGVSRV